VSLTSRRIAQRLTSMSVNLVAFAALLLAGGFLVPGLMGYERYVITGGSMSGSIELGSLVFEREVPVGSLKVGDVITYLPPADSGLTDLVTHRIYSIENSESGLIFRTKGDANGSADPWKFLLDAPTQPKVEVAVPVVGHLFIALANPEQRMLVIGVPAAIVAFFSLLELIRVLRIDRRIEPATYEEVDLDGAGTPRRDAAGDVAVEHPEESATHLHADRHLTGASAH